MQVCGPSQSGKTVFVSRLVLYQEDLFENPAQSVKWYSPHGEAPAMEGVESIVGLPWDQEDAEEETANREHKLIVIDDFAQETQNSKQMTKFVTQHSHHRNISIIQITQNLFWSGSESRTTSLNMHYITLMRQTRDQKQIRTLARQISHSRDHFESIVSAYSEATRKEPFSYLLLSLHPRDPAELLLRTNIFPEEAKSATVYTTLKKYK